MEKKEKKKLIVWILILIITSILSLFFIKRCGGYSSEVPDPVNTDSLITLQQNKSDSTPVPFPLEENNTTDSIDNINRKKTTPLTVKTEKVTETEESIQIRISHNEVKEKSMFINGVYWATRNVDMPGTFTSNPEDKGKFYQWNRKKAWPTDTRKVNNWDSSMASGDIWEKENDPCPAGWRLPTFEEIGKLCDKSKVNQQEWVTINGIRCEKFTDKANGNFILVPAAGSRHGNDGKLYHLPFGYYWSMNSLNPKGGSYMLCYDRVKPTDNYHNRNFGFCVRCVAETE
jgi:uncharacterized protein (TIGR02145 family)